MKTALKITIVLIAFIFVIVFLWWAMLDFQFFFFYSNKEVGGFLSGLMIVNIVLFLIYKKLK